VSVNPGGEYSTKRKQINHNVYPSVNPTIHLCMVTHLNPLDQESERFLRETHGHPVGFLVPGP